MCTVTVLRAGDMVRIACNRDERRTRAAAHPPFIALAGGLHVLTPRDPQGGGTWVAANSAGLVFALLNVHPGTAFPGERLRSRGLVIPSLMDAVNVDEAALRLNAVRLDDFAPFRLLVADSSTVTEFVAARGARDPYYAEAFRLDRPRLFTSSSLGDAVVEGPRRMLFEQMFVSARPPAVDIASRQDAFHAHRWRDRPAVSVHMSRPDACTVSTTTIEVTGRDVRMLYQPAHCFEGTPVGLVIERQGGPEGPPLRIAGADLQVGPHHNARDIAARQPGRKYAAV